MSNNIDLTNTIKELIGPKPFKLAYIPSQTDKERIYFEKVKPEFMALGITDFFYFDVDEEYQEYQLEEFKSCDGVFLSGGNTYYFLKNLQDKNINVYLKQMVLEGKLLTGVSAGSIIMSKTIKIASFYDENEVKLEQLDGLNLVDFEFMPHWQENEQLLEKLLSYSLQEESSIFTCADGDGIVIKDNHVELFGAISEIRKGKIIK
ncbi:alpha-aspartyl dipeptidase peptidase E [Mesobacillus selenatarsenatis SF-1]|uniref:Alpha-aspartyl dipeptidase peptidase E n=1 Tax=Mesobacillus selenatarsenatis (strain DSM 18680 / JCM 14380 / FERM P-15431 / SF-1) TaxID=1321606 RepID=A0A0A8X6H7_MESS1|nr:alpha-aspartyl dipeptidase peptidase E [Mesobacillus selenatarsenatis SF-1]